MADPAQPPTSGLVIPPEVQEKFAPILTLIQSSESMNMEERQYWINILPIMTPEQLKNLEDILSSEKKQLAAIDAKYANSPTSAQISAESMEQRIRNQKEKRRKTEEEDLTKELTKEEEILSQIQSL